MGVAQISFSEKSEFFLNASNLRSQAVSKLPSVNFMKSILIFYFQVLSEFAQISSTPDFCHQHHGDALEFGEPDVVFRFIKNKMTVSVRGLI